MSLNNQPIINPYDNNKMDNKTWDSVQQYYELKKQNHNKLCKTCKEGNTMFETTYDSKSSTRVLTANCTHKNCTYNIKISAGNYIPYKDLIDELKISADKNKTNIILEHNNALFNYEPSNDVQELLLQRQDSIELYNNYMIEFASKIIDKSYEKELKALYVQLHDKKIEYKMNCKSLKKLPENSVTAESRILKENIDLYLNHIQPIAAEIKRKSYMVTEQLLKDNKNMTKVLEYKYSLDFLECVVNPAKVLKMNIIKGDKTKPKKSKKTEKTNKTEKNK
ncbi:hypothetical protein N8459_02955 [Nitrosopumilus sp.]|nr:hypothetical protein [Nitrosopumilus sp.]